ncbi:PEGA domain-containing protein [Chondromyces crocatus]|uniref:PEGA domain-containing protein n=1 Tax=Chondromyces crocatus TaxID=52 RepID=A0A0K1EGD6_CHOCO|nr:PEGA domain-containing protein [Chondromyces crocatus]AKT39936.1 uncharacterized protein CMC5_040870 [Chondromyces crocatus]
MTKVWRSVVAAIAISLMTWPVQAQGDPVTQAKSLFNAGAQAYERAQYPAAIQAFEEAYRLSPRPGILFSIAQAERRQYYVDKQPEHVLKAITLYNEYLASVPQGGRRSDVVQALAELEPIAARLEAAQRETPGPAPAPPPAPPKRQTQLMISSTIEGAVLSMDGGEAKELPFIEEVKAGKHRVKVSAPGYFDDEREIVAPEGGVVALDVTMRERPARLFVKTDAQAEVSIDGRVVGEAPLVQPVDIPAGKHLVTITRGGRKPFSRELQLERGELMTVDAPLDRTMQRYLSYGLFSVGVAGLVVGGAFGGLALREQGIAQEIYDRTAQGNVLSAEREALLSAIEQRNRWREVSSATAVSGAVLGAAGVLLYLLDNPTIARTPAPEVSPKAPTPRKPRRSEPFMEVLPAPLISPDLKGAMVEVRF